MICFSKDRAEAYHELYLLMQQFMDTLSLKGELEINMHMEFIVALGSLLQRIADGETKTLTAIIDDVVCCNCGDIMGENDIGWVLVKGKAYCDVCSLGHDKYDIAHSQIREKMK